MCEWVPRHLSTADVSAALGVGESSVKRWIDSGKLTAEKTPGGHRRVGLTELYSFMRVSGRQLVDPAAVGLPHDRSGDSRKDPIEICQKSLQEGDAFTLESALQVQRIAEQSPAAILDKTLFPAFRALRASCQHPSEECMVLHRALLIVQSALRTTMTPLHQRSGAKRPRIVLADIGYEVDGIPTLLAEAAVWDEAHCLQLGTNVPTKVIEGALQAFDADVLWLSASGPANKRKLTIDWRSLVESSDRLKVKIVAYGDAVPRIPNFSGTHVTSFGEFRGFVSALAGVNLEKSP